MPWACLCLASPVPPSTRASPWAGLGLWLLAGWCWLVVAGAWLGGGVGGLWCTYLFCPPYGYLWLVVSSTSFGLSVAMPVLPVPWLALPILACL